MGIIVTSGNAINSPTLALHGGSSWWLLRVPHVEYSPDDGNWQQRINNDGITAAVRTWESRNKRIGIYGA